MVAGLLLALALLVGVSVLSARKAQDAESFATAGGRANAPMVAGIVMTSLVSGQSTIGTAQLAFAYGISAWWFTIGAAFGCLLLALGYGKALRRSGCATLLEVVALEYGHKAETVGSLLCLVGIFISIVAQILSSSALMTGLLHIPMLWAATASVALMALTVAIGGVWGAGYSGMLKAVLLYAVAILVGFLALRLSNGYGGLMHDVATMTAGTPIGEMQGLHSVEDVHDRFGSLVARGPMKDIGGCISLMLGVVATQTYAQGIWAARSNKAAVRGGLLCAFLTPFIGAGCVLAGLYMRAHYVTAAEANAILTADLALPQGAGVISNTAEAFPAFVLDRLPGFAGGMVMGIMFLAIVGGGAGLALGAATIMGRDVYGNVKRKMGKVPYGEKYQPALRELRITIAGILLLGMAFSLLGGKAFINDLGFLSLGLRATAVLVPLTAALLFPMRVKAKYALASMVIGTGVLLLAQVTALPGGPIWWGMGAGVAVLAAGIRNKWPSRRGNVKKAMPPCG